MGGDGGGEFEQAVSILFRNTSVISLNLEVFKVSNLLSRANSSKKGSDSVFYMKNWEGHLNTILPDGGRESE